MLDCHGASGKFYNGNQEGGIYQTREEILAFQDGFLKPIRSLSPDSEIVFVMGNHEQRLVRRIDDLPGRASLLDIQKQYTEVDTWVDINDVYYVNNMGYAHGIYYTDAHSKKHALHYQCDLMYGHVHDASKYALKTGIHSAPITAQSVGCLCDLNPVYQENSPSNWINGFGITLFNDDEHFNYPIEIKNKSFIRNNKLYKW